MAVTTHEVLFGEGEPDLRRTRRLGLLLERFGEVVGAAVVDCIALEVDQRPFARLRETSKSPPTFVVNALSLPGKY